MRAPHCRDRGKKIYSLHAPETECIGKGKAHEPYELGVKVSGATCSTAARVRRHVMPGVPSDGPTLATLIPARILAVNAPRKFTSQLSSEA